MEMVEGKEFFDVLKDRYVISEKEAVWYSSQIVLALQFLHSKKVAYRDLKPENIMVRKNGYIKLIDFGLGKRLKENKTYTLCGTP